MQKNKKKEHHFHNVQSKKEKKRESPEHDINLHLSITIPCTTPLSHKNI